VELLDAGADDYVTKPFGFDELVARMRAALRRTAEDADAEEPVVVLGPLRIDRAEQRVWRDGEEVRLSPTEFALLLVLARHPGKTVTHRQLLESVWGTRAPEAEGRLRVYMTYLRRKLERDPVRPRLLITQAGVGYRLDAREVATP
jgi:two-component system KDP operon response regulator KdpE